MTTSFQNHAIIITHLLLLRQNLSAMTSFVLIACQQKPFTFFRSNLNFGPFQSWFRLQNTFRVRAYTCRPVYNSVVYGRGRQSFLHCGPIEN